MMSRTGEVPWTYWHSSSSCSALVFGERTQARARMALKPADIVLGRPVSDDAKQDVSLWTGCIAGGLPRANLAALVVEAGFRDVQVLDGIDVFAGAPQHSNAAAYGTIGAGIRARKPAVA